MFLDELLHAAHFLCTCISMPFDNILLNIQLTESEINNVVIHTYDLL